MYFIGAIIFAILAKGEARPWAKLKCDSKDLDLEVKVKLREEEDKGSVCGESTSSLKHEKNMIDNQKSS